MRLGLLALVLFGAGLFAACHHPEALVGSGQPVAVVPPVTPQWAAARKLYMTKCSRCHKLYDPRQYDDAEWSAWMSKMSRKAKLKPGQPEMIADYVDKALRHPEP
jgi:hypothetical protein